MCRVTFYMRVECHSYVSSVMYTLRRLCFCIGFCLSLSISTYPCLGSKGHVTDMQPLPLLHLSISISLYPYLGSKGHVTDM